MSGQDRSADLENSFNEVSDLSARQKTELRRLARFQPVVHRIFPGAGSELSGAIWNIGMDIISQPDLDGRPLFFNRLFSPSSEATVRWFEDFGVQQPPVEYLDLSQKERANITYGIETLKLPALVATHLVKNRAYNQGRMEEEFGLPILSAGRLVSPAGQPNEEVQTPALLPVVGYSMQGKSLLSVELRRRGEVVISWDRFSSDNLEDYWTWLEDLGLTGKEVTTSAVVKAMLKREWSAWSPDNEERGENESEVADGGIRWTAGQALDELVDLFRGGRRPERVFIDMPGYRYSDNLQELRSYNVFDLMGRQSMTAVRVIREAVKEADGQKFSVYDGEMAPEVIEDYLKFLDSEGVLGNLVMIDRLQSHALAAAILGDRGAVAVCLFNLREKTESLEGIEEQQL